MLFSKEKTHTRAQLYAIGAFYFRKGTLQENVQLLRFLLGKEKKNSDQQIFHAAIFNLSK